MSSQFTGASSDEGSNFTETESYPMDNTSQPVLLENPFYYEEDASKTIKSCSSTSGQNTDSDSDDSSISELEERISDSLDNEIEMDSSQDERGNEIVLKNFPGRITIEYSPRTRKTSHNRIKRICRERGIQTDRERDAVKQEPQSQNNTSVKEEENGAIDNGKNEEPLNPRNMKEENHSQVLEGVDEKVFIPDGQSRDAIVDEVKEEEEANVLEIEVTFVEMDVDASQDDTTENMKVEQSTNGDYESRSDTPGFDENIKREIKTDPSSPNVSKVGVSSPRMNVEESSANVINVNFQNEPHVPHVRGDDLNDEEKPNVKLEDARENSISQNSECFRVPRYADGSIHANVELNIKFGGMEFEATPEEPNGTNGNFQNEIHVPHMPGDDLNDEEKPNVELEDVRKNNISQNSECLRVPRHADGSIQANVNLNDKFGGMEFQATHEEPNVINGNIQNEIHVPHVQGDDEAKPNVKLEDMRENSISQNSECLRVPRHADGPTQANVDLNVKFGEMEFEATHEEPNVINGNFQNEIHVPHVQGDDFNDEEKPNVKLEDVRENSISQNSEFFRVPRHADGATQANVDLNVKFGEMEFEATHEEPGDQYDAETGGNRNDLGMNISAVEVPQVEMEVEESQGQLSNNENNKNLCNGEQSVVQRQMPVYKPRIFVKSRAELFPEGYRSLNNTQEGSSRVSSDVAHNEKQVEIESPDSDDSSDEGWLKSQPPRVETTTGKESHETTDESQDLVRPQSPDRETVNTQNDMAVTRTERSSSSCSSEATTIRLPWRSGSSTRSSYSVSSETSTSTNISQQRVNEPRTNYVPASKPYRGKPFSAQEDRKIIEFVIPFGVFFVGGNTWNALQKIPELRHRTVRSIENRYNRYLKHRVAHYLRQREERPAADDAEENE